MKKTNIIALSVLAIGMASCSSDTDESVSQTDNRQPLEIGTYLDNSQVTRATHISTDPSKGYSFFETGFYLYANVIEGSTGNVRPFMNNQKISYDETNSKWTYSPIKYWPTEDGSTIDFYPRYVGWDYEDSARPDLNHKDSENIKTTYDWNNVPQVTFYVNETVSKQTDYIWAAPILGAKRSSYPIGTPVKFNFKHALSAFTFTLRVDPNGYNPDVTRIVVNSVTIRGYFAPKATLNPRATDINSIWNLQGDWEQRSYTISKFGDNELWSGEDNHEANPTYKGGFCNSHGEDYYGTDMKNITRLGSGRQSHGSGVNQWYHNYKGTIMVLPFANSTYTVTLDYDVITFNSAADKVGNTENFVRENYKASKEVVSQELKPGYIYQNNIILHLQSIDVDATLEPWIINNNSYDVTNVELP